MTGHTQQIATHMGFIDARRQNIPLLPRPDDWPLHLEEQELRLNTPPIEFIEQLPFVCTKEWKEGSINPDPLEQYEEAMIPEDPTPEDSDDTTKQKIKIEPGTELADNIPLNLRQTALIMMNRRHKNWIPYPISV